jgi:Isochorismatase family
MATSSDRVGKIVAEPEPIELDWTKTALVIIDMQRDFMEPGGFGETLGNDVSRLARAVQPITSVLSAARETGMLVIHTREGHLPDLSDAPPGWVASSAAVFGGAGDVEGDQRARRSYPPLTAPAVSPATICRCANTVSSSTGKVTSSAAAASGPQLNWSNEIML